MCIICNKDSGYNRYYKKSESSVGYELYYCKYCINNGIFVLYTNIHNEFVLCGFKIAGNNRIMLSKNVNESIED